MEISLFLTMLFIPLFLSVGDKIGIVLYNNELSGEMMQYSCICMVPIAMCNLTGSILNALNLEHKSFKNYIWGSISLIISLVVFTPIFKIYSITIAYFIAMSIISLQNSRKIKQVFPNLELNFSQILTKYTFAIIPTSLLGHLISNILNNLMPIFFSGLIGGGISLLSFLFLVYTFHVFDIKTIFNLVKSKKSIKPLKENV